MVDGAAAVAAGLLITSGSGSGVDGALRAQGRLAPPEVEPGVVHVHGLGVDPGDGVLYAATHSGLFRIPEQGKAARVANRVQDTMGFSIVGPGRFIGSGHPDFREDDVRPPLLGLIESDDAGETWERLSLHGEADFHALAAAHPAQRRLVRGQQAEQGPGVVDLDRAGDQARARSRDGREGVVRRGGHHGQG